MYSVYAIKSVVDGRIYVGMSKDIEQRLKDHNLGCIFSTKGYKLWMLIYIERVGSRIDAREKEKFYKSGSGKELLKKIIPG